MSGYANANPTYGFFMIGLFGGTFNPIHIGHLRTVREVQEGFGLDKICFIPSALPPHKKTENVIDAEDRLEMIRLAVADAPDFMVSDVELQRSGLSYTIDTVHYFKSFFPEKTIIYFIIGIDAFLEIYTWKSYKELFQEIPFIVMARPDSKRIGISSNERWKILEEFLQSKISDRYKFSSSQNGYIHDKYQPVFIFNVTLLDISATKIRQLIKDGKSVQFLVPEKVEDFIKTNGLFRMNP